MTKNRYLKKGIDKQLLKIIAVLFMFCDHIATVILILFITQNHAFVVTYNLLRKIGRISFPIFLFCIVDGLLHTKRIKTYILKVTILGIVSIIPYSLAFHDVFFFTEQLNVLITFSVILFCFSFYVKILYCQKSYAPYIVLLISFLSSYFLTQILFCEYRTVACIGVLILLLFKNKKIGRCLYVLYLSIFNDIICIGALPFLLAYNGAKIKNNKLDTIFYLFYPLHLLLLYLIRLMIS